jgi:predicted neutral ceramidase superfamily lipid hydrolase
MLSTVLTTTDDFEEISSEEVDRVVEALDPAHRRRAKRKH